MREIKFRGMRIKGEWAYGLLSISQGYPGQPEVGYYISNSCGMPWAYSVRPETVGQYIDSKDKNGKEICEGDIALTRRYIVENGKQKRPEKKFVVDDSIQSWHTVLCLSSDNNIEIIGNIHENSELLEATG